jgi:hypothetical protein
LTVDRRIRRSLATLALTAFTLLTHGCGGDGKFGETIRHDHQRNVTSISETSHTSLRFPTSDGFNVYDAHRSSVGLAVSRSTANSDGTAHCEVDVSKGGSGQAEFQVGEIFSHNASSPQTVRVTIEVSYECSLVNYSSAVGDQPIGLKVYIKDSNRRMLSKAILAEAGSDQPPTHWTGLDAPTFVVTLEPHTAYHLVVAGRVHLSDEDDARPHASIQVKSVRIDVTPEPS